MFPNILAQTLSAVERVKAVHEQFAGRTAGDGLTVLYWFSAVAVGLIVALAIAHRVQTASARRRRERRPA